MNPSPIVSQKTTALSNPLRLCIIFGCFGDSIRHTFQIITTSATLFTNTSILQVAPGSMQQERVLTVGNGRQCRAQDGDALKPVFQDIGGGLDRLCAHVQQKVYIRWRINPAPCANVKMMFYRCCEFSERQRNGDGWGFVYEKRRENPKNALISRYSTQNRREIVKEVVTL